VLYRLRGSESSTDQPTGPHHHSLSDAEVTVVKTACMTKLPPTVCVYDYCLEASQASQGSPRAFRAAAAASSAAAVRGFEPEGPRQHWQQYKQ